MTDDGLEGQPEGRGQNPVVSLNATCQVVAFCWLHPVTTLEPEMIAVPATAAWTVRVAVVLL